MLSRLAQQIEHSVPDLTGLKIVTLTVLSVSLTLLGIRETGYLNSPEQVLYDQMVRWSPEAEPDPRLLIISVTEEDLRNQEKWPFSDQVITQLLQRLQAYNPRAIGLDLYRDFPVEPGHNDLKLELQRPNVITIRNIDDLAGTPAPPASPPEQVGFNNIPVDLDNVVRRNLLFAETPDEVLFSFSLRLALLYLAPEGISPQNSDLNPNYLQLGNTTFIPLAPHSGGYHQLDDSGYQILLTYRSPHAIAREITFTEALLGPLDPQWVQDKVVLIGSSAPSLQDRFFTPYSPTLAGNTKMPGVVIHSHMVSQLLDAALGIRPLFQFWPDALEIAWLLAWSTVGGVIGWWFRHPLAIALSLGISGLILIGIGFGGFLIALWIPLATPAFGLIFTLIMVITYQSYDDNRRQKIVMKLLGQNTSPEIAEALWRGRDHLLKAGKLPGIRLTATMLFLDIKGFSTISEKMSPEELLDWLNELLGDITHEVLAKQGIVNKFTGDGVMAVFGVPMTRTHHTEIALDAQRAVHCALGISQLLDRFNQWGRQKNLPHIQMRIGIFTGPVVVGSLGGKDRLEYGVLGDSVNTAARLESCEKERQPTDCRILIADKTLVYLDNQFEVESWGLLALKGKEQMVEVYRVKGNRE
ncbi:adenylate/guanylate cyclase domain-containing protein [Spirulina subsalsa FACHB-351]|uniref:Adenylate/guanylate cyclase domain-containing protein n=1 Tax=Spirulina subsalsa FACHB-351 TaxID=234711 RepID=A0ABT3L7Z5_9CYAN|nr:adenylate/guanylate cyclase domain-containing protein [Spirulina subsalsa FACHB-351]